MLVRTQTPIHFCCHGRTNTQKYRDFADCDPFDLVSPFDNDSATASSVVLGAAVPETLHCLPSFSIGALVRGNMLICE